MYFIHLTHKKFFSFSVVLLSIVGYGAVVFATPNLITTPTGGYLPGTELDPVCAPNQVAPEPCIVKVSPGESTTANNGLTLTGMNVQLGGTLVKDTNITTGAFKLGINTPVPTATLDINGTLNQINGSASIRSYADPLADMPMFAGYFEGVANAYAFSPGNTSLSMVGDWDGEQVSFFGNVLNDNYLNGIIANGSDVDIMSQDPSSGSSANVGLRSNASATSISLRSPNGHVQIESPDVLLLNPKTTAERASVPLTGTIRFNSDLACLELYNSGWGCLGGGSSGWSLTGNAGTTAGTNFIGTTDAQDFMIKTNGNQVALFGQGGDVALGFSAFATGGDSSFAQGSATASGKSAIAMGYDGTTASGGGAVAIGHSLISSGNFATAFGTDNFSRSYAEFTSGLFSTDYVPQSTSGYDALDRLFTIGNGNSIAHNAYTLWKDGSFAYNDDNFQNDNPGTEQNMFYFNYGSHDGLGVAQTKRAIRLGSAVNDEWDINSANVGDRSVVIGFSSPGFGLPAPNASGDNATAFGVGTFASGAASLSLGMSTLAQGPVSVSMGLETMSSGDHSFAWGYLTRAVADGSTAWGQFNSAEGRDSTSWGIGNKAFSAWETSFGIRGTPYIPASITGNFPGDRLVNIGNGNSVGSSSDALTILKNGQTGIAIDNFETNTNGNIFQVGDGTTNVIGYVDSGTGAWVAVSDARKKDNIADVSYGLDTVMKLSPKSYTMKSNGEASIGFLAQDVLPIVPESVFGSEEKGYGMSYSTLVPVTVKAIQELNVKVASIASITDISNTNFVTNLKNWFASASNGIMRLHVDQELCIGNTCINETELQSFKSWQASQGVNSTPSAPVGSITDSASQGDTITPPAETSVVTQEQSNPLPDPVPASGE